jgi:hybrid cluster-associated redox disulfide protein
MEHPPLSPRTLLADLLASSPLTARALLDLRVDCIGCSMNKFCTIEEICQHYGLEIEAVMKRLRKGDPPSGNQTP